MANKLLVGIVVLAAGAAGWVWWKGRKNQIKVTVVDSYSGRVINGATVRVEGGETKVTDNVGFVSFSDVAAGTYNVFVSAPGYYPNGDTVTIDGGTVETRIDLPPKPNI